MLGIIWVPFPCGPRGSENHSANLLPLVTYLTACYHSCSNCLHNQLSILQGALFLRTELGIAFAIQLFWWWDSNLRMKYVWIMCLFIVYLKKKKSICTGLELLLLDFSNHSSLSFLSVYRLFGIVFKSLHFNCFICIFLNLEENIQYCSLFFNMVSPRVILIFVNLCERYLGLYVKISFSVYLSFWFLFFLCRWL